MHSESRIKIAAVPNTTEGIAKIEELRNRMKYMSKYGPLTYRLKIYGRCHDRKGAFAQTGRPYRGNGGNNNSIYSLKSKEAPFCYEWAVYMETFVKTGIEVICHHIPVIEKTKWGSFKHCKICGRSIS
jgi:hypothetical protein